MAGVFSPLGKFAVAVAFVISNGIASLQVNSTSQVFYGAVEVAAASVLYMLLPQSRRLSNLFTAHGDRLPGDSLRKNVILRLRYTAEAMRSASDSVDRISEKLETTAAADLPHVYGPRGGEGLHRVQPMRSVLAAKIATRRKKRSRGFRIRCGSAAKSNAATLMCRF